MDEHGIAAAFYSSDGEHYRPVLECLCGYSTGRQYDWEEAGALLDAHLLHERTVTVTYPLLRDQMNKPPAEPPFKLVIDTREQQPFTFEGLVVVRKALKAGDYSIEGLEDRVAVERKNKSDAWGCMSDSRARFERCAERLAALDRALIVIECSLEAFCIRPHQIERVNVASAVGGYISIMVRYGIPVVWCDNRVYAERVTARFLASYFKHRGAL